MQAVFKIILKGGEIMSPSTLEQYLKNNGISQVFIAKQVGMSRQHLNAWIRRRSSLPVSKLHRIEQIVYRGSNL